MNRLGKPMTQFMLEMSQPPPQAKCHCSTKITLSPIERLILFRVTSQGVSSMVPPLSFPRAFSRC